MVNPIKIGIVSGTDGILSIFVVEMASRVQKTFFFRVESPVTPSGNPKKVSLGRQKPSRSVERDSVLVTTAAGVAADTRRST